MQAVAERACSAVALTRRARGPQVLYWLGNFDFEKTRFLLDGARGPLRLDLGDLLYAPNLLRDERVPTLPAPAMRSQSSMCMLVPVTTERTPA